MKNARAKLPIESRGVSYEFQKEIDDLERINPDFKALWEDRDTCDCCKVDYDQWESLKVRDWRRYDQLRFLRGDKL